MHLPKNNYTSMLRYNQVHLLIIFLNKVTSDSNFVSLNPIVPLFSILVDMSHDFFGLSWKPVAFCQTTTRWHSMLVDSV